MAFRFTSLSVDDVLTGFTRYPGMPVTFRVSSWPDRHNGNRYAVCEPLDDGDNSPDFFFFRYRIWKWSCGFPADVEDVSAIFKKFLALIYCILEWKKISTVWKWVRRYIQYPHNTRAVTESQTVLIPFKVICFHKKFMLIFNSIANPSAPLNKDLYFAPTRLWRVPSSRFRVKERWA